MGWSHRAPLGIRLANAIALSATPYLLRADSVSFACAERHRMEAHAEAAAEVAAAGIQVTAVAASAFACLCCAHGASMPPPAKILSSAQLLHRWSGLCGRSSLVSQFSWQGVGAAWGGGADMQPMAPRSVHVDDWVAEAARTQASVYMLLPVSAPASVLLALAATVLPRLCPAWLHWLHCLPASLLTGVGRPRDLQGATAATSGQLQRLLLAAKVPFTGLSPDALELSSDKLALTEVRSCCLDSLTCSRSRN